MISAKYRPDFGKTRHPISLAVYLIAGLVGFWIATQSLEILSIVLASIGLTLFALITPFSALAFMLILAPMRTLIATESSVQLPLDIGQLSLIIFAMLSFVYTTARNKNINVVWSPIFIPILIFITAITLSCVQAVSLGAWLTEWLKWVIILILIPIIFNIARKQWEWLLFSLTLAGVANAMIGIYIFFGGSGANHLLINNHYFRAFGTFGQPNPFGGFMGLLAPLAFMAVYGYGTIAFRRWRAHTLHIADSLLIIYYLIASLLICIALFFSWSRGAWLGFTFSYAIMAFAIPRRLMHSFGLVACFLAVIGGLWISNVIPPSVVARVTSSTAEFFAFEDMRGIDITPDNYAVAERLAHWQAALNMAEQNPLFGVGMGNYEIVYSQYRLVNWDESLGHAHNYYLNILAETGMIGLIAYLSLWIWIIWLTWKTRQHPDPLVHAIAIGLVGAWIYLSVHSLLDNLYVNNLFLHIGVMLGMLAFLYQQTWEVTRSEQT